MRDQTVSSEELIKADDLQHILNDDDLVILATAMKDPFTGSMEPFPDRLIPGTRFFDLEQKFSDLNSGLPHTLPDPDVFQQHARDLGIHSQSRILIYDFKGLYSAPRVWWMFKVMGHEKVQVLDGGLPGWERAGYLCSQNRVETFVPGNFVSQFQSRWITFKKEVLNNIHSKQSLVLDARASGRFWGMSPEPRQGLRGGHIPDAKSLPFTELLNNGESLALPTLEARFAEIAPDKQQPLILSCGSGVTACVLALLASHVGYQHLSVYDGSWSEWGSDANLPITARA